MFAADGLVAADFVSSASGLLILFLLKPKLEFILCRAWHILRLAPSGERRGAPCLQNRSARPCADPPGTPANNALPTRSNTTSASGTTAVAQIWTRNRMVSQIRSFSRRAPKEPMGPLNSVCFHLASPSAADIPRSSGLIISPVNSAVPACDDLPHQQSLNQDLTKRDRREFSGIVRGFEIHKVLYHTA